MADRNDLLEEAAARAVDLAKKAVEASVALDGLKSQADSLTGLLSTEVAGIRQGLQALTEALDGDALRTARAETVAERRTQVRDAIDAAVETARAELLRVAEA